MPQSNQKRDLVVTFAHGYQWKNLAVFFHSLKKSGFNGDVVVFASRLSAETKQTMRRHGVMVNEVTIPLMKLRNILLLPGWKPWKLLLRMISGNRIRRSIAKRAFNIMCARFAHFHGYLEANPDKYARVLITDIRDVCFQADPFAAMGDAEIISFLEPLKIEGGANGKWMREAFGDHLDATILNEWVCCAGVTIGKSAAVLDYLGKMLNHLYQVKLMTPVAGVDQAVHNHLFHRKQLPGSKMMQNGNPVCMTMGHGDPYTLDSQQRVSADGQVIAILHQFDRSPELKVLMNHRFGA